MFEKTEIWTKAVRRLQLNALGLLVNQEPGSQGPRASHLSDSRDAEAGDSVPGQLSWVPPRPLKAYHVAAPVSRVQRRCPRCACALPRAGVTASENAKPRSKAESLGGAESSPYAN